MGWNDASKDNGDSNNYAPSLVITIRDLPMRTLTLKSIQYRRR